MQHRIPRLRVLAACAATFAASALAGTPAPASADTPHDVTRPQIMQQASDALAAPPPAGTARPAAPAQTAPRSAATSSRPLREVFGFAQAGNIGNSQVGWTTWHYDMLSTVAYFGVHVNPSDGTLVTNDTGWSVWQGSDVTSMINAAHSAGARVVLTIVEQQTSGIECTALQHYATTVQQTVSQVAARGVDGVNIDYESVNAPCGSSTNRAYVTALTHAMRAALPSGAHLTVDTYASSARDSGGFYDIGGMAADVNGFFVMAYELDNSNWGSAPLSCSRYCLSPTSPLSAYAYSDTQVADDYTAVAGAGKTILGLPYYGYTACTENAAENAYPKLNSEPPGPNWTVPTYSAAQGQSSDPSVQPGTYQTHRDSHDGADAWATWTNTTLGCTREMYLDDATSLAAKYSLVNQKGILGAGLWSLDYGGGAPELWNALATAFGCPASVAVASTQSATKFNLALSAPGCSVTSFEVRQADTTEGTPALPMATVAAGGASSASVAANGFAGHQYQFSVRATRTDGLVSGWSAATTTVSATATQSHVFRALWTLDSHGGLGSDDSPPVAVSGYDPGSPSFHAARPFPGSSSPQSGLTVSGNGALWSFGAPAITVSGAPSFPFDIARDVAFVPDGSGGYELDGYGGVHPFGVNGHAAPPMITGEPYFGFDIARRMVVFADGRGGYISDGWGGIHPFGIGANPPPATPSGVASWPGWDIAHDLVLLPGSRDGYVLDGYGGVHPFAAPGDATPALPTGLPYFGFDIARDLWLVPSGSGGAGYMLDGWGGIHPVGGTPAVAPVPYWAGRDLGVMLAGA